MRLPLSTLDVLDGRGPIAAKAWASDLLDLGYIDDRIVDLAIIDDDDWERSRRLCALVPTQFGVHDLSDRVARQLRLSIPSDAFAEGRLSPRAFLTGLLARWSNFGFASPDANTLEGKLWTIDETIHWAIPPMNDNADARRWVESLAADGLDPEQPELWLDKEVRALLPALMALELNSEAR